MPSVSRVMIRAALIWQGLGALIGALLLAAKVGAASGLVWALREAHIHILLAGWLVQFAIGVAFWIMPRHDAVGNRGDPWRAWAGCSALNLALALVVVAAALAGSATHILLALAGALYTAAFVLLVSAIWPRVLPFRNLPRPERSPHSKSEDNL